MEKLDHATAHWDFTVGFIGLEGRGIGGARSAAAERIVCESLQDRHQYCRIDTHNQVSLMREFSRDRCRERRTWGYDRRGVWVDEGCRAEFRAVQRGDRKQVIHFARMR
ncbi:MAG: DUF3011 domain-containing protein [Candidatus Competibacterales bacterium]